MYHNANILWFKRNHSNSFLSMCYIIIVPTLVERKFQIFVYLYVHFFVNNNNYYDW